MFIRTPIAIVLSHNLVCLVLTNARHQWCCSVIKVAHIANYSVPFAQNTTRRWRVIWCWQVPSCHRVFFFLRQSDSKTSETINFVLVENFEYGPNEFWSLLSAQRWISSFYQRIFVQRFTNFHIQASVEPSKNGISSDCTNFSLSRVFRYLKFQLSWG